MAAEAAAEASSAPDLDGFERQQLEESLKQSFNEHVNATRDCVYQVGGVHIESGGRGKGRIRGRLNVFREADLVWLNWAPDLRQHDRFSFNYPLVDVATLRIDHSRLYIGLREGGRSDAVGAFLPPLYFERGETAVKDFVAFFQSCVPVLEMPHQAAASQAANAFGFHDIMTQARESFNRFGRQVIETTSNIPPILRRLAEPAAGEAVDQPRSGSDSPPDAAAAAAAAAGGDASDAPSAAAGEQWGVSSPPQARRDRDMHVRAREAGLLGSFAVLQDAHVPRPVTWRCTAPMTVAEFRAFFDQDGRVRDDVALRRAIFTGGLAADVRREAWCYLLDHAPPTCAEADAFQRKRREEYATMKAHWQTVSEMQLSRNAMLRDRLDRVRKDVGRTDRDTELLHSDDSPYLVVLHDVLCTYCMYNFDLGYVQGMSDLAAQVMSIMLDEADTFWCFAGLMETMRHNFAENQQGIEEQLKTLRALVQFMQPQLMDHLDRIGGDNMYFVFRWILVLFKREFDVESLHRVWDVIFSRAVTPRYHLFVTLAMIEQIMPAIMETCNSFDELLGFVSGIGKFDAQRVLDAAGTLVLRFLHEPRIPEDLRTLVLGTADPLEALRSALGSAASLNPARSISEVVLPPAAAAAAAESPSQDGDEADGVADGLQMGGESLAPIADSLDPSMLISTVNMMHVSPPAQPAAAPLPPPPSQQQQVQRAAEAADIEVTSPTVAAPPQDEAVAGSGARAPSELGSSTATITGSSSIGSSGIIVPRPPAAGEEAAVQEDEEDEDGWDKMADAPRPGNEARV